MEATMFTGWIYDHLKPQAAALKVAHPLMLRAIAAEKKKNDHIDADKICDCLRCDFLPECYMASTAIRERRRILRYRNLLVRQVEEFLLVTGLRILGLGCNRRLIDSIGSSDSELNLLADDTHSFKYDIRKTRDGVRLGICCYRWKVFWISLLWTMTWALAAAKALSAWDKNYFIFLCIPFCALLAGLGAFNVVNSLLSHTLTLSSPSELRVRSSFFGLSKTRSITLSDISSFGFGHFSHSLTPMLRLELRNPRDPRRSKWIAFARGTTEREVDAFLQDVEAQGFRLPRSC